MDKKQWNILFEDREIIVCTKPHGIPVQSRSVGTLDMESMLKARLARQGESNPYLAVIHRLDQPVSGILVFAKSKKSAGALSAQLRSGSFSKYYRALADGIPPAPSGTLEDYLVRDGRTNTSRICSPRTPGAKKASLEYRTEDDSFFGAGKSGQTELEIHLLTGRHHQIRVQLAHMGCPIAGDTKYNPSAKVPGTWQELKLCAFRLEFAHPSDGRSMRFCLDRDI